VELEEEMVFLKMWLKKKKNNKIIKIKKKKRSMIDT
jgi:hypothetical protein